MDYRKPVAIPLSEEAAQGLVTKSEKAPYGNHKETLLGEAVRKMWQISVEGISFQKPQWEVHVGELVQSVIHELGVRLTEDGINVRAKLYKHLLYEPGAMFKSHKE